MTVTADSPLEDLSLPVRPYNCLKRADINTVADLCSRSRDDLMNLRVFGVGSLRQVEASLGAFGLELKNPHLTKES